MNWIRKKWKAILLSLVLLLVLGTGSYAWWLYDSLNSLSKPPEVTKLHPPNENSSKDKEVQEPPKWEGRERVNILLLGADARGFSEHEIPRTDTIMVASIDPVTKTAHLMSIMRDTLVDIPDEGKARANTALQQGANAAMKTFSDWTGLDIQYYMYTDFRGFIALIDAMGGVEMDVEKDMNYTSKADNHEFDIHLAKGLQVLDGDKALQYVRFRYDALSDYARTARQRKLLGAVADKLKTAWSLIQLPHLINQMAPYIETNLKPEDMIKLGILGLDVQIGKSQQLPPSELLQELRIHNEAVLGVRDEDALRKFIKDYLEEAGAIQGSSTSGNPDPLQPAIEPQGSSTAP
ncbi:MAG: LCP family protein [Paenibacillus sp.]|nr:LCP family protein [Paenibacillus sp.]